MPTPRPIQRVRAELLALVLLLGIGLPPAEGLEEGAAHLGACAAVEDSANVLAVVGHIFQFNGATPWPTGDTLTVTNLRSEVTLQCVVGSLQRGYYGVLFCEALSSQQLCYDGDSLYFRLPAQDLAPVDSIHVLSPEEIDAQLLELDLVVDADVGGIDDAVVTDSPNLRIYPHPAQVGEAKVNIWLDPRIPVTDPGARLRIMDIQGRCVRRFDPAALHSGAPALQWDGRDQQHRPVPAGTYFVGLVGTHVGRAASVRLVVLK